MASIIQLRRDTAANWTAADPILAEGEIGLESDTGDLKVGNGVDEWSALGYYGGGGIPDAPSDGTGYVRKDGAWAAESGGGGGAVDSVNGQTGVVSLDLADLDDVDASGVADGDVLTWDNTAGEWVPEAPSGGSDLVDVSTPTNSSGTVTLDFAGKTRYVGTVTLGANVTTLAFANLPGAGKFAEYEIHIAQDGTGSRTFAIPASHKALGGSDTAIAAAANAVTVLTASTVNNGTTWRYAMQESA